MTRLPPLLCAAVVIGLSLLLLPGAGLAGSMYSITADSAMDIPSETVTHEGKEYIVDSVSRVSPDDSITVETTVPDEASYKINLRGPDNQIISSERKTGDSSHTIDYFGSGEAGSYAITIQNGGTTQAIHPIIIQGFDITVSAPETAKQSESVTVEATVDERSIEKHSSLEYVQLVVANDDEELIQKIEKKGETTYRTTFSTSKLSSGQYSLYVGARGDKNVRDRAEILAISDPSTLTISEQNTESTPADTDDPNNQETQTQTPTQTNTPAKATPTENTPSATPSKKTTDRSTPTVTATPTLTDGVITPSTSTAAQTTEQDGAGFSMLYGLIAILGTAIIRRKNLT